MTFFVDRSLGRRAVPSALRQAGFDVVVHDQERNALEAARVQVFALTAANLTGAQQAHLLRTHAACMERFCAEHPGPFVVGVYQERPFLRRLYPRRRPRRGRGRRRRGA